MTKIYESQFQSFIRPFPTTAHVSFTAQLSGTDVTVSAGNTLVYDRVINNAGEGYNNTNGIFTTPINGTYQFIWTGMSHHTGTHFNWLTVNGVRVAVEHGPGNFDSGKIYFDIFWAEN